MKMLIVGMFLGVGVTLGIIALIIFPVTPKPTAVVAAVATSSLSLSFTEPSPVIETGSMNDSGSSYWWLNSGALFFTDSDVSHTNLGALSFLSPWRLIYARNNPVDTDNGYHPQNIFRLITRSPWKNVEETLYARIDANNLSTSQNRNESNGILLFLHYEDSQNLYYAGVRVDGHAVIKKKQNGVYTTLAEKQIIAGTYDREHTPNLLPTESWIGLRAIITEIQGVTYLHLFVDLENSGSWTSVLEARDTDTPIKSAGYAGIRTDFMDVEFKKFSLQTLSA